MAKAVHPISPGTFNGGNAAQIQNLRGGAIRDAWLPSLCWSQLVKFDDWTETDTGEELDLDVAFAGHEFPNNVIRGHSFLQRVTDHAGGGTTAITIAIGDTNDDNGLVTALDVFTGAKATLEFEDTVAAAEVVTSKIELAFIPTALIATTTANIDDMTAGAFIAHIQYWPFPVHVTS